MTCFWDGVISALGNNKIEKVLEYKVGRKKSKQSGFIKALIKKNVKISDVTWNGIQLGKQAINENFTHIKNLNVDAIKDGYLCSVADPVLFLICYLFKTNIKHQFNGTDIIYKNKSVPDNVLMTFRSDDRHFWVIG